MLRAADAHARRSRWRGRHIRRKPPDRSQPGATSRIGRRASADWFRATVAACSWSRLPCRRRCWRLRDLMGEACTLSEVHRAASRPCSKRPLPAGAGALSMDLCGRGARRLTRSKARLLITMMWRCLSMSLALSIRATRPPPSTSWPGGKEKAGRERMDRYGSPKRGA